jgi:hypothetical protein
VLDADGSGDLDPDEWQGFFSSDLHIDTSGDDPNLNVMEFIETVEQLARFFTGTIAASAPPPKRDTDARKTVPLPPRAPKYQTTLRAYFMTEFHRRLVLFSLMVHLWLLASYSVLENTLLVDNLLVFLLLMHT